MAQLWECSTTPLLFTDFRARQHPMPLIRRRDQSVFSESSQTGRQVGMLSRQLRAQSQPRRGLRREEAAAYLGFSARKFDELIADGRMPKPKRIDGVVVWDIHRLDVAFDSLPDEGGDSTANPWG